jgi:hypothetical protein
MPSDLTGRIALLEARLSLLERRMRREDPSPAKAAGAATSPRGPVAYGVDQPGLIISDAYEIERDHSGRVFCWVGGAERVQFVFPHNADRRQICCLHLQPHPRVDFARLRVVVNDESQKHVLLAAADDLMQLKFPVEDVGAPNINVLLLNLRGVRPEEIGENDDGRLLTARFYGADFAEA